MKAFTQKVKLEERQELYEKQSQTSNSKQIRPQFLSNNSLLASLPQNNPASIYRPKSTSINFNPRFSTKNEQKASEIAHSAHRSSLQDNIVIHRSSQPQKTTKKMMRRRSCCCEWCGGISNLEMKHNDVVLGEDSPQATLLKIELATSTFGHLGTAADLQVATGEKINPTLEDTSPKAVNNNDPNKLNPYKLLTINTIDPTPSSVALGPDAIRYDTSQTPNSLLLISPDAKAGEQSGLDGFKVFKPIRKKTDPRGQEEKESPARQGSPSLQRQGSFSPIRLRRDVGMSSIQAKKAEEKKHDSVSIDLPAINSSTLNMASSPKWIASPTNVMQKLCRDVSGYIPSSPQKIAKLSTPLSATFTEKIRMQQTVKLEMLKGFEGREHESVIKETRAITEAEKKRATFFGLESKGKEAGEDKPEDPVVLKPTGYQLKSKNRLSSVGTKKENSLRMIRAKIASIYIDDKSNNTTFYNKSMGKMKTSTPIKRVVSETQTLLLKSEYRTEASKTSFLDTSKELTVKEDLKQESKSPRVKKWKKRKNTANNIKAKEEHFQWLMQTFVPTKKNSLSVFPSIPQSLQNKIAKRREDKIDQIEQIVASYAE